MPTTMQQPTDVGTYTPEHDRPPDDTPTADDVSGAVRVAQWLWKKHVPGYLLAIAGSLWVRVSHPTITTAGGATSYDSSQDARIAAHLLYADTAAASSRAERRAVREQGDSIRRDVRDLTLVVCELLGEDRRRVVSVCHRGGDVLPASYATAREGR